MTEPQNKISLADTASEAPEESVQHEQDFLGDHSDTGAPGGAGHVAGRAGRRAGQLT